MGCLFTCQTHLSGIGFKGFPNKISTEISELGKCALNKCILSSGNHLDNSSINMLRAGMGQLVIALSIFPAILHIYPFRSYKGKVWLPPVSQEAPAILARIHAASANVALPKVNFLTWKELLCQKKKKKTKNVL